MTNDRLAKMARDEKLEDLRPTEKNPKRWQDNWSLDSQEETSIAKHRSQALT